MLHMNDTEGEWRWPSCWFRSTENVPVRNSDVDYRLLEAAKAGDLDTVKVFQIAVFSQHEHIHSDDIKSENCSISGDYTWLL